MLLTLSRGLTTLPALAGQPNSQGDGRTEAEVAGPTPDRVAIDAALAQLPANHRRAVILHYLADLSISQIAAQEGVAEGTVKSWLHRGRTALAGLLDENTEGVAESVEPTTPSTSAPPTPTPSTSPPATTSTPNGAVETIAVVACRYGEASAKQVVAFDRNPDGRIVTVGRVVRTGDGFDDIRGVETNRNGSVEVRVADIVPCCGTPSYPRREQVRTYQWDGQRFGQTDGPTAFGKDPRLTDLRMTMTHELVDVPGADTRRKLTTVFTVTNAGPVDAAQVAFHSIEAGERAGGHWSRCDPKPGPDADHASCLLPGVPVGESRRYTFVQLVPNKPGPDATTRRFLVLHCDAQDRQWPDLTRDDNEVPSPLRF